MFWIFLFLYLYFLSPSSFHLSFALLTYTYCCCASALATLLWPLLFWLVLEFSPSLSFNFLSLFIHPFSIHLSFAKEVRRSFTIPLYSILLLLWLGPCYFTLALAILACLGFFLFFSLPLSLSLVSLLPLSLFYRVFWWRYQRVVQSLFVVTSLLDLPRLRLTACPTYYFAVLFSRNLHLPTPPLLPLPTRGKSATGVCHVLDVARSASS